uniref:Uncharacterized protein n=1 Tax=Romanomermis culicivorax TaxID=13658 RepID=A0A915IYM0_ROMCU
MKPSMWLGGVIGFIDVNLLNGGFYVEIFVEKDRAKGESITQASKAIDIYLCFLNLFFILFLDDEVTNVINEDDLKNNGRDNFSIDLFDVGIIDSNAPPMLLAKTAATTTAPICRGCPGLSDTKWRSHHHAAVRAATVDLSFGKRPQLPSLLTIPALPKPNNGFNFRPWWQQLVAKLNNRINSMVLNFGLRFGHCYGHETWNGGMQAYADACSETLRREYSMFAALQAIKMNAASLQHQLYHDVMTAIKKRIGL